VAEDNAADVERAVPPDVSERLRERRVALGMSVRELARRLSLSPSLISQIERGKAMPSVATLYAITTELRLSMDQLFSDPGNGQAPDGRPQPRQNGGNAGVATGGSGAGGGRGASAFARLEAVSDGDTPDQPLDPVVRPDERKRIQLDSGVRWERLTRSADPNVDFLHVVYEPGGASCDPGLLMRHSGREYGHVLSGTLEVTVGFESYVLGPGDSISFDSTVPHRLATIGDEPVHAIWFVVGRSSG
jgi:mannose-6-phosphate isomerase-like protein (cupin superfamily)/DNA-binding XRE family transcriptional regulator